MAYKHDFDDIRPFDEVEFPQKIAELADNPYFRGIITAVMPGVDYDAFAVQLKQLRNANEFQQFIIRPWLENLARNTSDGYSYSGIEHVARDKNYLFISNHRDIVLDASFLCVALLTENYDACRIAIGSNLLIYPWICDMVKINGSFIVKRGISGRPALEAAHHLSDYIHYAITQEKASIWIAQREGRAKDSDDNTQEALIKMLCLGGEGDVRNRLMELNFAPVSISYEYDPCDSLKSYEFLCKSKDPNFKKSERDDLKNMETGIMGYKGRMHWAITPSLTPAIAAMPQEWDKMQLIRGTMELIDRNIHANYRIYEGNYVAYDMYYKTSRFAPHYDEAQRKRFTDYLDGQIARLGNLTAHDRAFVLDKMLLMYSNPLKNRLAACGEPL